MVHGPYYDPRYLYSESIERGELVPSGTLGPDYTWYIGTHQVMSPEVVNFTPVKFDST